MNDKTKGFMRAAGSAATVGVSVAFLIIGFGFGIGRIDGNETISWPVQPCEDCQLRLPANSVKVSADVPRKIRTDQTKVVTANLRSTYPSAFEANLDSPSFDIKPFASPTSASVGDFGWKWLISAKKAGNHALSLTFSDIPPTRSEVLIRSVIEEHTFQIDVVTELGLTPKQDALVKLVAAALGLLGTILGYPFFKRHFEASSVESSPVLPVSDRPYSG